MATARSKRERNERARKRRSSTRSDVAEVIPPGHINWPVVGSFAAISAASLAICFLGLSPAGPILMEGQTSRIRVIAEIPFEYQSQIQTQLLREQQQRRLPPVYRIDMSAFERFERYMVDLMEQLESFAKVPQTAARDIPALTLSESEQFLEEFGAGNPYSIDPADLQVLANDLREGQRAEVLQEGLAILEKLFRDGIFNPSNEALGEAQGSLRLFNVEDETGKLRQVEVISDQEALRSLRINLTALDIPRSTSGALFRIIRTGLEPNLEFDLNRTESLAQDILAQIEPVDVSVPAGNTIIESNQRITPLQLEQLEAYRRELKEDQSYRFGLEALFIQRMMLAVLILAGLVIYLRITDTSTLDPIRVLGLCAAVVLPNLVLMRLAVELGESEVALEVPMIRNLVSVLLPVAMAPVVLTALVGPRVATAIGAVMSAFAAMMLGSSMTVLAIFLLSILTAVQLSRSIQYRSGVVRAATFSGLMVALGALLLGLRDNLNMTLVLSQMIAASAVGVLSGIIVVGVLPLLERTFKYTTDITLLELTDFNHPLLRRMQVEAPGSYHHSLMVANLAENAAATIGANPLLCRTCSLFHDIGKMIKPEYFSENQRDGYNPHLERNPSMSALVIKAHVKEGVQLARQFKLPRVVIDVIRQHHGSSLIQYFYYKALEQQKASAEGSAENAPRIDLAAVDEDTYRYDGPRPNFVESGIIMLADSIEAAGRSLRKVSPQNIDELVDNIVASRLEDGQLDETPLTFKDLKAIRRSFSFTLLNMLHSRVEYPEDATAKRKAARKQSRGTQSPLALAAERAALGSNPPAPEPPPARSEDE